MTDNPLSLVADEIAKLLVNYVIKEGVVKIADDSINLKEALKRWGDNDVVWSIERGGLGLGYEQAIQIGIFELSKVISRKRLPSGKDKLNKRLDEYLAQVMKAVQGKARPVWERQRV